MSEDLQVETNPADPAQAAEQLVTPPADATPSVDPQPTEPVVTQDLQQAVAGQTLQVPTPEQDFLNAYDALCKEKGFQHTYEARPTLDLETGIYNFSKIKIAIGVVKFP